MSYCLLFLRRKEDDQSAKQMELQNAIKVTNEAVKLCLCNKFTEAQNLLKPQ